MEITYLKTLKNNPNLKPTIGPIEGWDVLKIHELEEKYNEGNPFPKAFREYLFLAGEWGGTGVVNEDWGSIRQLCDEDLIYWGNTLDRPFFVFDKLDSQYSIFFLDEDKEDPEYYILNASWDDEDEEPLLKRGLTRSFSRLIEEAIHRINNDIPF